MNKYWIAFKIGWQDSFEYRSEFFLSLAGWFVRLLISIFIWLAVFKTQNRVGLYDLENIIVYFLVLQIVMTLVFSRIGFYIGEDIHTGDFSNFLIKPISYGSYQIVSELSRNLLRTIISAGFFLLILIFLYPQFFLQFNPLKIIPIVITLFFAYTINALITMIIGYSGFWITDSSRLMFVYFAIITAISGITIPLDLFPKYAMDILNFLPFSYIFFYPTKIFQSDFDLNFSLRIIAIQMAFLALFYVLSKIIFHFGVKHYEAVGR